MTDPTAAALEMAQAQLNVCECTHCREVHDIHCLRCDCRRFRPEKVLLTRKEFAAALLRAQAKALTELLDSRRWCHGEQVQIEADIAVYLKAAEGLEI